MATVLKTFTGESAIEALKKAKEECGESAMLVTTKQIQPKTLNKKPLYEILVSVEEDTPQPSQEQKKQAQINQIQKQIEAAKLEFAASQAIAGMKAVKKVPKIESSATNSDQTTGGK